MVLRPVTAGTGRHGHAPKCPSMKTLSRVHSAGNSTAVKTQSKARGAGRGHGPPHAVLRGAVRSGTPARGTLTVCGRQGWPGGPSLHALLQATGRRGRRPGAERTGTCARGLAASRAPHTQTPGQHHPGRGLDLRQRRQAAGAESNARRKSVRVLRDTKCVLHRSARSSWGDRHRTPRPLCALPARPVSGNSDVTQDTDLLGRSTQFSHYRKLTFSRLSGLTDTNFLLETRVRF